MRTTTDRLSRPTSPKALRAKARDLRQSNFIRRCSLSGIGPRSALFPESINELLDLLKELLQLGSQTLQVQLFKFGARLSVCDILS